MKSAVVVGATSHIGFALCQKLIQKEVEVLGLELSDELPEEAEEKLMEIGRNAFFRFQEPIEEENTYPVAFICLKGGESNDALEKIGGAASKIMLIAHSSLKSKSKAVQQYLTACFPKDTQKLISLVFLPATYGPWQSDREPIQKRIEEEVRGTDQKESIVLEGSDILFVDDAAEALIKIAFHSSYNPSILLVNEQDNTLEQIAKELDLKLESSSNPNEKGDEEIYRVKPSLTIKESLFMQKEITEKKLKQKY